MKAFADFLMRGYTIEEALKAAVTPGIRVFEVGALLMAAGLLERGGTIDDVMCLFGV